MRISDWSSDVCSSDLRAFRRSRRCTTPAARARRHPRWVTSTTTSSSRSSWSPTRWSIRSTAKSSPSNRQPLPRFHQDAAHHGHRNQSSRSEEHTSELQSLMRISYAVFCLKKKTKYQITEEKTKLINKKLHPIPKNKNQ